MSLDFDFRVSRYDKDQQKRRDEAKKKRMREDRMQKEQLARERELLKIAEAKRLEAEKLQEEQRIIELEEARISGGIKFRHNLIPFLIDGEGDRVTLPESCLNELSAQEAFSKGAMTFQLQYSAQHQTHCGVREFTAPEGTIGLPKKVVDSVFPPDIAAALTSTPESALSPRQLSIKYVLLSKCVYVKLQPKKNTFFDVGPVKLCLEENLRFHSTLSKGDVLTVWYRGKAHELIVVELKPEESIEGCSLIDTDVEVDLDFSEEYLKRLIQKEGSVDTGADASMSSSSFSATGAQQQASPIMGSTGSNAGSSAGSSSVPGIGRVLGGRSGTSNGSGGPTRVDAFLNDGSAVDGDTSSSAGRCGKREARGAEEKLRVEEALYSATIITGNGSTTEAIEVDVNTAPTSGGSPSQLAPEPDTEDPAKVIVLKIKSPASGSFVRRFYRDAALSEVFAFVAHQLRKTVNDLQLSTRFPQRTWRYTADVISQSIQGLRIDGPAEQIFVSFI